MFVLVVLCAIIMNERISVDNRNRVVPPCGQLAKFYLYR